jgi:diacylglycerol kinase
VTYCAAAALGYSWGGIPKAVAQHTKQSSHCSVAFTVVKFLQVTGHNHVTMYGQAVLVCVVAVAAFWGAGS